MTGNLRRGGLWLVGGSGGIAGNISVRNGKNLPMYHSNGKRFIYPPPSPLGTVMRPVYVSRVQFIGSALARNSRT